MEQNEKACHNYTIKDVCGELFVCNPKYFPNQIALILD